MKTRIMAFMACLVLGACSTAIETRTAMPQNIQHDLVVDEVVVSAEKSVKIEQSALDRLKTAVENGFAAQISGTQPVHVSLNVKDFKIQSEAGRLFLGAFMGANYMDVRVVVTSDAGMTLAEFDVRRESNPGGYGAFYSQTDATVDETAEGIVNAVMGKTGG